MVVSTSVNEEYWTVTHKIVCVYEATRSVMKWLIISVYVEQDLLEVTPLGQAVLLFASSTTLIV